MDGIDQAVALIVCNRILLRQAMEQRLRARQAVETAKLTVVSVMRAVRVAEQDLRVKTRRFSFRSSDSRADPLCPSPAVVREQAAKARRYACDLAGDAARIDRSLS
jgi:hypothetical protein